MGRIEATLTRQMGDAMFADNTECASDLVPNPGPNVRWLCRTFFPLSIPDVAYSRLQICSALCSALVSASRRNNLAPAVR